MTNKFHFHQVPAEPAPDSAADPISISGWQSARAQEKGSPRAPRILHCAETIQGGIANYLIQLLPVQLRDFGPDSLVIVVPRSQEKYLPKLANVKVFSYKDTKSRVLNAIRLAAKVRSITSRFEVDVVHIHSTFAGVMVRLALAAQRHRARVIYCPHGWAFYRVMPFMGRYATIWIERILSRLCDYVVCVSEFELKSGLAVGIAKTKLKLVLNGIAVERPMTTSPVPQWLAGRKKLLFVGRFDRQKGLDIFLGAMHLLGDQAHGYVAGGAVLDIEDKFSVPDNVTMVGWLPPQALEAYFETADALVMPSRWEGLPLAATEAMRASLPVISSRVGGIPEVVVNGETGVTLDPCTAADIARVVLDTSQEDWARMGAAGAQRFKQLFTIERVHRQLCDLYGLSEKVGQPS